MKYVSAEAEKRGAGPHVEAQYAGRGPRALGNLA